MPRTQHTARLARRLSILASQITHAGVRSVGELPPVFGPYIFDDPCP